MTGRLTAHEGDYWRLLIPGTYTVTACADDQYDCVSKSVVVDNHPHTVAQTVDFTLPELSQQASFLLLRLCKLCSIVVDYFYYFDILAFSQNRLLRGLI